MVQLYELWIRDVRFLYDLVQLGCVLRVDLAELFDDVDEPPLVLFARVQSRHQLVFFVPVDNGVVGASRLVGKIVHTAHGRKSTRMTSHSQVLFLVAFQPDLVSQHVEVQLDALRAYHDGGVF